MHVVLEVPCACGVLHEHVIQFVEINIGEPPVCSDHAIVSIISIFAVLTKRVNCVHACACFATLNNRHCNNYA